MRDAHVRDIERRAYWKAKADGRLQARYDKPSHRAWKNEWQRKWRAANPDKLKMYKERSSKRTTWGYHLKKQYGITPDDYDRMFAEQGGRCAACGEPPRATKLYVDHDHKTGMVRGLVHSSCNFCMTVFDSPRVFKNFMSYKRRSTAMAAKQSRIARVAQYFREVDIDETRAALRMAQEIMDRRLNEIQAAEVNKPQQRTRRARRTAAAAKPPSEAQATLATAAG